MTGRFRVRTAQLADIVEQISRFDQHLESALADVDAEVNRLHANWTGTAADEHRAAHEKWKRGTDEMRAALATMRRIAQTACENYTDAATANASMWEQAL
jgi:WXG100 family type VII secretion target